MVYVIVQIRMTLVSVDPFAHWRERDQAVDVRSVDSRSLNTMPWKVVRDWQLHARLVR